MAFYTVLIPPPGGSERDDIERARLLPERFSWLAFFFTGVWLLAKRLWLAALLFVLVWGALLYAQSELGLRGGAALLAQLAIGLFLGLEGQNLIARKLQRKGWRLADVVEAPDLASAERRYFERVLAGAPAVAPREAAAPGIASPRFQTSGALPVIGLFPEAKGR